MQSLLIEIHTENCFCKAFGHVAYELQVVHTWELYKLKIPSWIKMTSSVKSSFTRGLSRRKIESVFRHFTKFNLRKTDSSQNSIWEKRTLHKIQYEKNGLFTKFNSVHVYVFRRAPHLTPIFLEVKMCPVSFLCLSWLISIQ